MMDARTKRERKAYLCGRGRRFGSEKHMFRLLAQAAICKSHLNSSALSILDALVVIEYAI